MHAGLPKKLKLKKEQNSTFGRTSLLQAKLKQSLKYLENFSSKPERVALLIPILLTNIFKNRKIRKFCEGIIKILEFNHEKWKIYPKLKNKNPKLKEKLKTQGKTSMSRRTCPLPPSQVLLPDLNPDLIFKVNTYS